MWRIVRYNLLVLKLIGQIRVSVEKCAGCFEILFSSFPLIYEHNIKDWYFQKQRKKQREMLNRMEIRSTFCRRPAEFKASIKASLTKNSMYIQGCQASAQTLLWSSWDRILLHEDEAIIDILDQTPIRKEVMELIRLSLFSRLSSNAFVPVLFFSLDKTINPGEITVKN